MSEIAFQLPHKQIGVAVIRDRQGRILIDRRRAKDTMGGLWEFPGGKIEEDETVEECIKREILEELAIDIKVINHLITIDHTYTKFRITLFVHCCLHVSGEPQAIECDEIRWVTVAELDRFTFPEANFKIIAALRGVRG
jgi:mutator protein MutT